MPVSTLPYRRFGIASRGRTPEAGSYTGVPGFNPSTSMPSTPGGAAPLTFQPVDPSHPQSSWAAVGGPYQPNPGPNSLGSELERARAAMSAPPATATTYTGVPGFNPSTSMPSTPEGAINPPSSAPGVADMDALPPDQGNAMGRDDAGQGSNPWGALVEGAGGDDVLNDVLRRRAARMRGLGGGGGFASVGGGARDTFEDPGIGFGTPSQQSMGAPSLLSQTRAAMGALPIGAAPSGMLPQVGDPAPGGGTYMSPMPTVTMDTSRNYKPAVPNTGGSSFPSSPSPNLLQPGGTSQVPAAPTTPVSPAPAPSSPGPVAPNSPVKPQSSTGSSSLRYRNGGRVRGAGLGKSRGATRGKRSPVTLDAKEIDANGKVVPVKMADGGRAASLWAQITQGRNALGTSGGNIMNTLGQLRAGGTSFDPLLARYISRQDNGNGDGSPIYSGRGSDRMAPDGTIMIGGNPYVQVGDLDPSVSGTDRYHSLDPGQFQYDDEFGVLTPTANMNVKNDFLDNAMPYLVGGALGGAALSAAMDGGVAAGAGGLDESAGLSMNSPFTSAAPTGSLPDSYWSATADSGGVASDAAPGAGPEPFEANYPDPGPQNFSGDAGATPGAGGSAGAGGSSGGSANPFSRVASWASSNPTSAIRIASGLAGAFGGRSGGGVPQVSAPVPGSAPTVTANNPTTTTSGGGATNPATDPLTYLQNAGGGNSGVTFSSNASSPQSSGRSAYIQKLLDEADKAGSDSEQEAAAGRAATDAAQRAARDKEAMATRLASQGIDPNDPRGVAGEAARLSALDNAKVAVGAENTARQAEKQKGFQQKSAAAGLAIQDDAERGRAQLAEQQMMMANARLSAQQAQAERDLQARLAESAAQRAFQSGENANERTWRSGESAADRNLRAQQINAGIAGQNANLNANRARNIGTAIGAAGSLPWSSVFGGGGDNFGGYGMGDENLWTLFNADGGRIDFNKLRLQARRQGLNFARGGDVSGPGTETSDSIPAQLSDGEFVVNAEGTKFLDKVAPGLLEAANQRGLHYRQMRQRGIRRAA